MSLSFRKVALATCVILASALTVPAMAQDEAAADMAVEAEIAPAVEAPAVEAVTEAAPAPAAVVEATNGHAYEATAGGNGAVFVTISNMGGEAETLTGVSASFANSAELHTTTVEADVTSMRPIEKIEIAAGSSVELTAQGDHIMLIGLTEDLKAGDTKSITLNFASGKTATVEVAVSAPASNEGEAHEGHSAE